MQNKPKIAFVSNADKNCGVYEYGKLTFLNLQKSKDYEYHFIEAHNTQQFLEQYNSQQYDGAIWNVGPFGWMIEYLNQLSQQDKPTFVITGHGKCFSFPNVKQYFICDPSFTKTNGYTALERPLIEVDGLNKNPPSDIIKIGSFGFGGWKKNFTGIVEAVNQQFSEPVEINLHITYGYWYEYHISTGIAHTIANKCREISNPNVTLNITHDFMSNYEDVVKFLNSNDINIFLYEPSNDAGISSCIDFALMAMKPLMVNKSIMFQTINWKQELLFEHNTIKQVLERGLAPTDEFRKKWCNTNIIKTFEDELSKHIFINF